MAKFEIKHSCGHTEVANICGKVDLREGRAKIIAEHPCSECRKAKSLAAHAGENKKAAESNSGLVSLSGSEKQIAWAESIRAKKIAEIEVLLSKIGDKTKPENAKMIRNVCEKWINESSAKVWIDAKDYCFDYNWLAAEVKEIAA